MDIDLNKVKLLLTARNYIVKVKQINDQSCLVNLPNPQLIKREFQPQEINYKLIKESPTGLDVNGEFWSGPEYALRLMISCDILYRMRKIPIHESLINYYDKTGKEVEDLVCILSGPSDDEQKNREGFLAGIFSKAIEDRFPPIYQEAAETHGVALGYRLLKSFF